MHLTFEALAWLALLLLSNLQNSSENVIYTCFVEDVKTPAGTPPTRVTFPPSLGFGMKSVLLTLEEKRPACTSGSGDFVVSRELQSTMAAGTTLTRTSSGRIELGQSEEPKPVGLEYFTQDGHVRVGNEYFAAQEYCIQRLSKYGIELRVCQSHCSSAATVTSRTLSPVSCISKCCDLGQAINTESVSSRNPQCMNAADDSGVQPFWEGDLLQDGSFSDMQTQTHFRLQNFTCADSEQRVFLFRNWTRVGTGLQITNLKITSNGNALLLDKATATARANLAMVTIPFGDYCVDNLEDAGKEEDLTQAGISLDSGQEKENAYRHDVVLIVCESVFLKAVDESQAQRQDEDRLLVPILYSVLMFLSCSLLTFTIILHLLLWDKLKFHLWVVLSYVTSLLLLYIFLGVANMIHFIHAWTSAPEKVETNHNIGCVLVGAATHLFLLSTFSWLTAINENLWTTFRTLNIPNSTSLLEEQRVGRFLLFSLFAWGIPGLVVGCGLGLDFVYKNNPQNSVIILPNYGAEGQCMLSTSGEGWYLFYPLGVLLAFNVIFFALTICRLMLYQRLMKDTIGERSDTKWKLISIYLKLLLLALLIWIFELSAWMLKLESFRYYWIIVEVLNLLQSTLIFFMFTCRVSVWKQLAQKYPSLRRFKALSEKWDRSKTTLNYGSNTTFSR